MLVSVAQSNLMPRAGSARQNCTIHCDLSMPAGACLDWRLGPGVVVHLSATSGSNPSPSQTEQSQPIRSILCPLAVASAMGTSLNALFSLAQPGLHEGKHLAILTAAVPIVGALPSVQCAAHGKHSSALPANVPTKLSAQLANCQTTIRPLLTGMEKVQGQSLPCASPLGMRTSCAGGPNFPRSSSCLPSA